MLSEEEKKIFALMDREEQVRNEIEKGFPEYDIFLEWASLHSSLQRNFQALISSLSITPNAETLKAAFTEGKFHLSNLISSHYTAMSSFFVTANTLREKELFDSFILEWKKKGPVKVVHQIRDRMQHGGMLKEIIHAEVRTQYHRRGAGVEITIKFPKTVWDAVNADVNSDGKNYLKSRISDNETSLLPVLQDYMRETDVLVDKLRKEFSTVYNAEFNKRSQCLAELDTIEKEFEKLGLTPLTW